MPTTEKTKKDPWRPRKYTKESFEEKLTEIINDDEKMKSIVSLKSISISLGINYDTFKTYIKEYEMKDAFSYLKEKVEENLVNGATFGKFQHNMVKHNLNNNFGWTDKKEVKHEGTQHLTIIEDVPKKE